MQTLKTKTLEWHHGRKPSPADLEWLERELHLHSVVLDELTRETMRPQVDNYGEYLYLVLHFPIFEERESRTHAREVDFILTHTSLVTVTYHPLPFLDDFFRKCSDEKACEDLYASKTPMHLLAAVVRGLYDFALSELDHIQERIDRIEEKVFSSEQEEKSVIEELSLVRRDVIDFRRSLKPQQTTLESLLLEGVRVYGPSVRPLLEGLMGEYMKVWNLLENNKEAIDALYDNNVAVLNIRQNETMRILSIMAFITFPLVLFAQLFSMSTVATPIIGHRYDFWIIIVLMFAATIAMFMFFKSKKWL